MVKFVLHMSDDDKVEVYVSAFDVLDECRSTRDPDYRIQLLEGLLDAMWTFPSSKILRYHARAIDMVLLVDAVSDGLASVFDFEKYLLQHSFPQNYSVPELVQLYLRKPMYRKQRPWSKAEVWQLVERSREPESENEEKGEGEEKQEQPQEQQPAVSIDFDFSGDSP